MEGKPVVGKNPRGLLEPNFVTNKFFFVKGLDTDEFDAIISILFDESFNYSMSRGKFEREGICQNSLDDNQSDISSMPAEYS